MGWLWNGNKLQCSWADLRPLYTCKSSGNELTPRFKIKNKESSMLLTVTNISTKTLNVLEIGYNGSTVAQWLSAWLETERPRVWASPASLRCGHWARHIYPSLLLVQPRRARPCLAERFLLLMGRKESNQTNKNKKQAIYM